CYWYLNPDLHSKPPSVAAEWKLEEAIYWAQTTFCLHRALECQPHHRFARRTLYDSYAVRDMLDAQATAGEEWLRADPHVPLRQREEIAGVKRALQRLPQPETPAPDQPPAHLSQFR